MERSRPTMKDVAVVARVSLKTVSRVVNGEPGVAPDTRQRVRDAIATLGFRRNDSARLLRTGQTATVGLVLEDIGDPFYSALSRGVESVARSHGSLLVSGSSDADPATEHMLALTLCARRVDGLIIVPTGTDHGFLLPEMTAGVPVVFADRPPGQIGADTVLSDNAGGAGQGTAHLIAAGHRRIGYLGDNPGIFTARERHHGYQSAMSAAGLPVTGSWVAMGTPATASIQGALERMLSGPEPVTAIFCGNNRISVLALHVLAALRQTIAMVGFDDFELADLLGITVIAQDTAEMGRQAAELLFHRLDGDESPPQRIILPTRTVDRGSGKSRPARV
jgi:LacI family transcriptional regulator